MPCFVYTYRCELNETTQLLGVCEASKREEFDERIKALCEAMGWDIESVDRLHCYLNSFRDNFVIL